MFRLTTHVRSSRYADRRPQSLGTARRALDADPHRGSARDRPNSRRRKPYPVHEDLRVLDVISYLDDTALSVFAEESIDCVRGEWRIRRTQVAASASFGLNPCGEAARDSESHQWFGHQGTINIVQLRAQLGASYADGSATIGGKQRECRLPAQLPLTDSMLSLFGIYIAEGNSQATIHHDCQSPSGHSLAHRVGAERIGDAVLRSSELRLPDLFDGADQAACRRPAGPAPGTRRLPDFWTRLCESLARNSSAVVLRRRRNGGLRRRGNRDDGERDAGIGSGVCAEAIRYSRAPAATR